MSYLGSWAIDDVLTFYAVTTKFDTGVATDADAVPSYRVYEDETGTALLNGTMALIDSGNTAGFYSEQITLSAANGFEAGKQYVIYKAATVNSVAGASHDTFQIKAKVNAETVATVTNLTNAPTNGDLTATMKTSVETAASSALTSYDPPTKAETDAAAIAAWTAALTEAYAADGAAFTPAQALFMIWSLLAERAISGTTLTAAKLDGTTPAMTFTLDDATTPTSQTRAT